MDDQGDLFTFAVLTLSDKGAKGEREDTSGKMLCELLRSQGYAQVEYALIPDVHAEIVRYLCS